MSAHRRSGVNSASIVPKSGSVSVMGGAWFEEVAILAEKRRAALKRLCSGDYRLPAAAAHWH
jgi:hypothetical protein